MKKINLVGFYQFGFWMAYLKDLKPGKVTLANYHEFNEPLLHAEIFLEYALNKNAPLIPLNVCQESGMRLLGVIKNLTKNKILAVGGEITASDISILEAAYSQFETVFAAEVPLAAAYFISPVRNYSTLSLLESAENEFDSNTLFRLPDICKKDIGTAGKCVAFELGTAAGFHSYRALESVAKDYVVNLGKMSELEQQLAKQNRRPALGDFLTKIEQNGADAKVVSCCRDIKNERRNPLAHPEENLSPDEGVQAFKVATTAIELLVSDMEKRKLYPTPLPAKQS